MYDDEYCAYCGHAEEYGWHQGRSGHCDSEFHSAHQYVRYTPLELEVWEA